MNRAARRARRRLRRGDAHREPLLIVTDDPARVSEWLELAARLGYRYRSELAPLAVGAALAVAGAVLHDHAVSPWWVALTSALSGAGLAWPRVAPLLRRVERAYAIVIVLVSGGWMAAAIAYGPGTPPLPALVGIGIVLGGIPWWSHRRRRAKVRVERTIDAWPDIVAAVGLPGSRVMSAVVDRWGWRARVSLPAGQTPSDLINAAPGLESGLHVRPGAVRIEPDPDRADHALVRVLSSDPHAAPIPYPDQTEQADGPAGAAESSVMAAIQLGLFEDATVVTLRLAHRHGLLGGVAGAGKSGVLNTILATLVTCPDVVLWGIDLKGGMELQPWAGCLARIATTPEEAAALLADAVQVLETRARHLAATGLRLWQPTPALPALLIVIDEYAELAEEASAAVWHADSIARRGRAVAVTLLAATQRPTQKAMGSGAVRSQMDVRICLRVRERRDVDLILGQGMLAAGWAADALNAPGKFLISTPEHTTPRRARAYRLTDQDVAAVAARHEATRPALDELSAAAITAPNQRDAEPDAAPVLDEAPAADGDPVTALRAALEHAPESGVTVRELTEATGMGRTWIYNQLKTLDTSGHAQQVTRGRWGATGHRIELDES